MLLKEPKGREVNDSDTFSYNAGLSEKLYRIKINSIQLKETVEENAKTNHEVMQDRQYQASHPWRMSPRTSDNIRPLVRSVLCLRTVLFVHQS